MTHRSGARRGFVMVLASLMIVGVITAVGFAVDMGRVYEEQRRIQVVADAASLAAVGTLANDSRYSSMVWTVTDIAGANAVTSDEVLQVPPQCGTWNGGSFIPSYRNECDDTSTAVRVTVTRHVPMTFARFMTSGDVTISARAVSYRPTGVPQCIRPFGVEGSFLAGSPVPVGGTFTVGGSQGSGNWGKLDISGNSSSGEEYERMMMNNACDDSFQAGRSVSQGTGNSNIRQVFDSLLSDQTPPFASRGMIVAVTSDFTPGNGTVTIQRFMRVDLLSQRGNGDSWSCTFRVVEDNAQPEPPPPSGRQLVQ